MGAFVSGKLKDLEAPFCAAGQHAGVVGVLRAHLGGVEDVVCLGLGCPGSRNGSRQLALLNVLLREMGWDASRAVLVDPAFGARDLAMLQGLGFRCDATARGRAALAVTRRTLFYMPHCNLGLYEQVLDANWCVERLPLVAVLGNRFALYEDRLGLSGKVAKVLDLGLGKETPLAEFQRNSALEAAFSDTSLRTFSSSDRFER